MNKKNEAIRQKISKSLRTSQGHTAHPLIGTYVDQRNLILVLQYVIYFAGLVARHLSFIESQQEVPPELKEAVASLCFVGSRYSELPGLDKLVSQFSVKYGEEFVANATMCKADCGVGKQIPELLLVQYPPVEERNKLLKEIANEFKINWKPVSSMVSVSGTVPVLRHHRPHDNLARTGLSPAVVISLVLMLQIQIKVVPSRMQSGA